MIIDAHQHFWHYFPERDTWMTDEVLQRDYLPADLAPILAANGVDGCVAVQADQSERETQFLLQLANENEFIKGVVGWVDLKSPRVAERLEYFSQFPLVKGFRHIVQGEPDKEFLLRNDFCRGIASLQRFKFTYDILIYPHQLLAAVAFAKKFPDQPFVLDHLAKPDFETGELKGWEQHVRALAELPNVCCKLSGMVTEADHQHWQQSDFTPFLDVALEAFGADRLMFGSDWPVCLIAADYPRMKQIVTDYIARLSAGEQAKIMGGTAAAFYQL